MPSCGKCCRSRSVISLALPTKKAVGVKRVPLLTFRITSVSPDVSRMRSFTLMFCCKKLSSSCVDIVATYSGKAKDVKHYNNWEWNPVAEGSI